MSDDMVERVARAMDAAALKWATETFNMEWECPSDVLARAAIGAMRSPTKPMYVAAFNELVPALDFKVGWEAAIDAALSPPLPVGENND